MKTIKRYMDLKATVSALDKAGMFDILVSNCLP